MMDSIQAATLCKALSDPNRLQIVQLLTSGEKCACKLLEAFSITQPTLSHHMKILCGCGLVAMRREGKWSYYSLNCETFSAFREFIAGITCCRDEKEGCCCS